MKRVHPNLGKKFSPGRLRRKRERLKELKAEGRKFGPPADPETHIETFVCQLPSCGKEFDLKVTKTFNPKVRAGLYCCQPHALEHTAIRRTKVPRDRDALYELYVVNQMSVVEIGALFGTTHHAVLAALKSVGIERRKGGVSRKTICARAGCDEAVLKLRHPQRGYMYGTLCTAHYWQHRKALYATRAERDKRKRTAARQQKEAA